MSETAKILIIDDDRAHAEATAEGLSTGGARCEIAASGTEGMERLDAATYDVVVTDLVMRDLTGLDILRRVRARSPETEVIVITGYPGYDTALEALDEGAFDYIDKPINLPVLRAKIRKAMERQKLLRANIELHRQLDKSYGFEGIIGKNEKMQRMFDILQQISRTQATVLLLGESGTGKELVARAIHLNSPRKGHRFVPLNCAALAETVLESELFGHVKGAFTGATYDHIGRFEFADKGTLFLDEIGDMPPPIQVKLLRVLEDGEIFHVGSNEPVRVNVRLIAATNKNLMQLVRDGKFRDDLYYRLNVIRIELPSLRERTDDIPLLIDTFLKEVSQIHGKKISGLTPEAIRLLTSYPWPGNVRELKNCIESMTIMARGEVLDVDDVPGTIKHPEVRLEHTQPVSIIQAEQELIKQALTQAEGNREHAARILGIGERTLYRKLKEYGIS